MPYKEVDKHSGAIIFKRTPEEKKIIELSKSQDELEARCEKLEAMVSALLDSKEE